MYFRAGEMAERSNAAVLKTVDCHRSGGSNPSLSARQNQSPRKFVGFLFPERVWLSSVSSKIKTAVARIIQRLRL